MATDPSLWQQSVEPYFGFLRDYGFEFKSSEASTIWETWVEYAAGAHGVRVVDSVEFDRVEVNLVQLVDGSDPPPGDSRRCALLDNVVAARSPDLIKPNEPRGGRSPADAERQLHFWSTLLPQIAEDFLAPIFHENA